ncbi:MAG: HlyD family type I secretion periplasmic adaptor subunit [Rubrivivax sp.]
MLARPITDAQAAEAGLLPFELEAEALMTRQRTQRARLVLRAAALVVLVLLVWAGWAQVDEVTRGEARVVPSRQLQVVQSLDGGVVAEIAVREGDLVEPGQLLLRIDETRATSGVRESSAQGIALRARAARLRALAEGGAFQAPPAADEAERRVVADEQRVYAQRVAELSSLLATNRQQLAQREQELAESEARRASAQRGLELAQQEMAKTKPLLASGAVSEVDILRLERDIVRFRGDMEQAQAQIARVRAAMKETESKAQDTVLSFRSDARKELADVQAKLGALNESVVGLADRVTKAQVRSPVRGRVQRLLANTVGGVVQPGKDIVEIVPLDDTLVLEARIAPKDIAFIRPQQNATVKFSAYDFSIYGGLDATVENISPDTVVDERGNAFYVVRVRTARPSLGEKLPIIPGMTAEVDVLTGRKSVLSYLAKPVLKIRDYALRER